MPHTTKLTAENLAECEAVKRLVEIEKDRSGASHTDIGKMIGKSGKWVTAVCSGNQRVSSDMARKIAKAFGVPVSQILKWTAALAYDSEFIDVVSDLQELNEDDLKMARRLIRNMADSQE